MTTMNSNITKQALNGDQIIRMVNLFKDIKELVVEAYFVGLEEIEAIKKLEICYVNGETEEKVLSPTELDFITNGITLTRN